MLPGVHYKISDPFFLFILKAIILSLVSLILIARSNLEWIPRSEVLMMYSYAPLTHGRGGALVLEKERVRGYWNVYDMVL